MKRYSTKLQWEAAVTEVAAPYSWHTRSGIGAALDCVSAFSGERYIGYWDDKRSEGWVEERQS